jgi:hypothetical protein
LICSLDCVSITLYGPGFDPRILRRRGFCAEADEARLNKEIKKNRPSWSYANTGKKKKNFKLVFSQPPSPLTRGLRDYEKHLSPGLSKVSISHHDTVPSTLQSKINYIAAVLPVVQVSKMLICNTVLACAGKPLFHVHSPSHDAVR